MFIIEKTKQRIEGQFIGKKGIQFPANWLSLATTKELVAQGILHIEDPVVESNETHDVEYSDFPPYVINKPKSIEVLVAARLAAINAEFETRMAEVKSGYPESEIASWGKQEQQARSYLSGETNVPLIAALAKSRNLPLQALAEKIVEKANLFEVISGDLIGVRQRLEDELKALDSDAKPEFVQAIFWPQDEE